MVQFENIGEATLYRGDCREVLQGISADALITDPVWPNCPPDLLPGGHDPEALWRSTWNVMPALTRAAVVMRYDSDPRFLAPVTLAYQRATILPYVIPGYIGRYLGGDEIAYCFGEPIPSRKGQRVIPGRAPSVQPTGHKANGHPCSRSIDHFMFLVRWWSEPDEIVLDPFMGSGTTGEASIRLGRKFVGVEIEQKYFDLACRRIEKSQRQGDMFKPKVEQQSLQIV